MTPLQKMHVLLLDRAVAPTPSKLLLCRIRTVNCRGLSSACPKSKVDWLTIPRIMKVGHYGTVRQGTQRGRWHKDRGHSKAGGTVKQVAQ